MEVSTDLQQLPPKLRDEVLAKMKPLQLLKEHGALTDEELEAKQEKMVLEALAKIQSPPSTASLLASAPHISPHITEKNSDGMRINAMALLNEYFQHIKEDKPDVEIIVLSQQGQTVVLCCLTCKINNEVTQEKMIGPNRKLVLAELALKMLRKFLPEFLEPDDILTNIRGMSRHRSTPAAAKRAAAKRRSEYHPGRGYIETPSRFFGSSLPVVAGDADDISRILHSYCEFQRVRMPNLVVNGYNDKKKLTASMELVVNDTKYSVSVEEIDLTTTRQEACHQILHKIFPDSTTKDAFKAEIERLHTEAEEREKKKQKLEEPASPLDETLPPVSRATTLLSYYCQITKQPMPDIDKAGQVSIKMPDGTFYSVTAQKINKKLARPEACHRLLRHIFPDKDLKEIQDEINEMAKVQRQVAQAEARKLKPPARPYGGRWYNPKRAAAASGKEATVNAAATPRGPPPSAASAPNASEAVVRGAYTAGKGGPPYPGPPGPLALVSPPVPVGPPGPPDAWAGWGGGWGGEWGGGWGGEWGGGGWGKGW